MDIIVRLRKYLSAYLGELLRIPLYHAEGERLVRRAHRSSGAAELGPDRLVPPDPGPDSFLTFAPGLSIRNGTATSAQERPRGPFVSA